MTRCSARHRSSGCLERRKCGSLTSLHEPNAIGKRAHKLKPIRHLKDIRRGDVSSVGTKAAVLGELFSAGFDVLDGFVLTTDAYFQILVGLRQRIEARVTADAVLDPAEIETMAGEVREWLEQEPWPIDLHTQLERELAASVEQWRAKSFAARTSLPSAELATAFGSGAERAVLGLKGTAGVELGAARCWGALWTSRSMYYRHRKKIPQTEVSLAVLIQPMLEADSAGIIFTQNPLTNDRDELEVQSIWGLGAPLTQARVKPDRFLVGKQDLSIRDRLVEDKALRLALASDGTIEQQIVDAGDVIKSSLEDQQAIALASMARQIEELFGEPQYIEWARVGERFYILQARPTAVRAN